MKRILNLIIINLKTLWNKGAFHILIGSFSSKFVAMFGSIIIVRLFTKQEYGILSYAENIYNYAYVIVGMGLANSILRFVVLAKDNRLKRAYFNYAAKNGLIFNILLIIIFGIVNYYYPYNNDFVDVKYIVLIYLVSLPFQHLTDDALFMERAMFANNRFAYLSLIITISVLVSRVFGALMGGLSGAVICQVVVTIILAIIVMCSLYKRYFISSEKSFILETAEKKVVNIYSIQFMITNGLWTMFMLNDTFLLGWLCQDASVLADYRVAYVLPGCLSLISSAIGTFVSPYFVKNEKDYNWIKHKFWIVFILTAILIGGASIIIIVLSKYLITFVYGTQYLNVIPLMNMLTIAAFINCGIRFTCANLLAAMGNIRYNMIVSLIGIGVQVVLNILLIPKFGVMGVAFTSIIVYGCMGTILFIVFAREYKIFH